MTRRQIRVAMALSATLACAASGTSSHASSVPVGRSFVNIGSTSLGSITSAVTKSCTLTDDSAIVAPPLCFSGQPYVYGSNNGPNGLVQLSWQGLATAFAEAELHRLPPVLAEPFSKTNSLSNDDPVWVATEHDVANGPALTALPDETSTAPQLGMNVDFATWTSTWRLAIRRHFLSRNGLFAVLPVGRHPRD